MTERFDAVIVGSGPNGLMAAITLAQAGRSVLVLESASTPGGGTRSAELTQTGFIHDVCSSIHPMLALSPAFAELQLEQYGLNLVQPDIPLAHPLDDGSAGVLHRSVERTALGVGVDAETYRRLMSPLVARAPELMQCVLGPARIPPHPLVAARLALAVGVSSAQRFARRFQTTEARALMAGLSAHSMLALDQAGTAGFGLLLGIAGHAVGWPLVQGGSQRIADAMVAHLTRLGGEIRCGHRVVGLHDVPASTAVLFDTGPHQLASIAGNALPPSYSARLRRFRYGPGIFKVDYALAGPIPWTNPDCRRAGTVHVGGAFEEIAASEAACTSGHQTDRPFVLVAQATIADPGRAPLGKHTAWTYCHVPSGSTADRTDAIESQLERFAPGFRDLVLARHVRNAADYQEYDANYVGGDIGGGQMDIRQLWARPTFRSPYTTPNPRLFICSSSTPPGAGVHGMCGWYGARAALRTTLR